jgi:iron complex transport system permease protein
MGDGDAAADGGSTAEATERSRGDAGTDATATAGVAVPESVRRYREHARHRLGFVVAIGAFGLLVAAYSVATGVISVPLVDLPAILLGGQGGTTAHRVVWRIRLPRIVAALGAGLCLAVSGAVLQSVLRNPLASPYTLGISQGAAFGAAVAIIYLDTGTRGGSGLVTLADPYLTTLASFGAAMLSTGVILAVAKYKDASPETLILTGIALASLFTAGTTVLEYFASNAQLAALVFWKFGDVGGATWTFDGYLWLVGLLAAVGFTWKAWAYNVLDAGDEAAASLGVRVERLRLVSMLAASFVTAVTVSMFGVIGFVGLVVPHMVRRVVGGDERFVIPASAVGGAVLLLTADTVGRLLLSPVVLPVGIVTAFVGAPVFVYLIVNGRGYW